MRGTFHLQFMGCNTYKKGKIVLATEGLVSSYFRRQEEQHSAAQHVGTETLRGEKYSNLLSVGALQPSHQCFLTLIGYVSPQRGDRLQGTVTLSNSSLGCKN